MSRSNYTNEDENNTLGLWRGAVGKALNGARGQVLLKDIVTALDAMPVKELVAESLVDPAGAFCTLGAAGYARGIDVANLDPYDIKKVAKVFNVAPAMIREIVFTNDEGYWWATGESTKQRWTRMRAWAAKRIKE